MVLSKSFSVEGENQWTLQIPDSSSIVVVVSVSHKLAAAARGFLSREDPLIFPFFTSEMHNDDSLNVLLY